MTTLTTQQALDEALAALHKLRIGRQATVVEADGRKVHYAPTNLDALEAYVSSLQDQLAGRCGRVGAIGFYL